MSHHLDTPLARQSGQLFIDDLYVFDGTGPDGSASTVFVMDVNSTITCPDVSPGFGHEARYEFKVHVAGEQFESLTYRVTFGERDADGRQDLQLHELTGADAREDSAQGRLVLTGSTGETAATGEAQLWAGRVADAFYIDLSLLSIVNAAVKDGTAVDLSGWQPAQASNSFTNTTVETIVLSIPHTNPVLRPGTDIGVWCATKLATDAGGWRQINRAGNPMMWPIFWPDDTRFEYPANTRHPSQDFDADAAALAGRVAAVVAATGTTDDPDGYGSTVARSLFPDLLRYEVGTPASFGFATRNGRTIADNAPEVMLSLVTNTAVPAGLRPEVAAPLRSGSFPYLTPA